MEEVWIILDTNFLMIPESEGVDIFSELDRLIDRKYEIVVPEVVLEELDLILENGSSSEKKAARVGISLASRAKKAESEKSADDEIMRLAKEKELSAVGTNDSELQKRLREEGIPVIFLRQKSHLDIDTKI